MVTPKSEGKELLVTQPYVPNLAKYMSYVEQVFKRKWLTNGGPLLNEFIARLKSYFNVEYIVIVNNGTTGLQLAYQIKQLRDKTAVTTPFTFPATTTALQWQGANIKFGEINERNWNLCPHSVKKHLRKRQVSAIVPVNIFGAPCEMEVFDKLGKEHNIPVIYDSAQALLAKYKGKSIFQYGDIHCVSFHATKLFHSVEGGALIFKNKDDFDLANELINFGLNNEGIVNVPGINAKMSELHAAMGLCILDELPMLIADREKSVASYKQELENSVVFQSTDYGSYIPPMYMPVAFKTEAELLNVNQALWSTGYQSRRYFYPNNHKFLNANCDVNNDNTYSKVLCLPLIHGLTSKHIKHISEIVKKHASLA